MEVRKMKGKHILGCLILVIGVMIILGMAKANAATSNIDVSQPVQVTDSTYYERGESVAYDGTDYWLFYARSDTVTGNYGNDNPDTHDYKIYYKKAATIDGLAGATATLVPGSNNINIYMGETDAVYFDGKIWVFASSDVGPGGALYAWNTTDGSSWDEWNLSDAMGIGLLPDGAAHFAAAVCDGKLWVAYQLGNDWNAKYWDGSSWSSQYDISTGYGTAKFYVEGTDIYFVRAAGNLYLYWYNGVSDAWEQIDTVTETGAYDPTIYKIGSNYVCAYAPWVSPKQWIKAKVGTSLNTLLSTGTDVNITAGMYGSNPWVDMWPYAFTDAEGDTYLFFTSERNPTDPSSEITGNIWYLKVDWDVTHDHFDYIQPAIDAATGTTINVAPGTYTESITINKSIDLVGNGATIVCPSSPESVMIGESGHTYEYVIGIFGGTYGSGNDTYYGSGTVTVHISGFDIDSNNYVPSDRYVAIFLRNMVGSISDCTIINTDVNGHETFGILGYGDGIDVNIYDNTIDQFARGGIGINGGSFIISGNTVIGPGLGVPVTWAPNGIQAGYGATGTISNNEVSGCGWPGTDWAGTGILVVDTHGVVVDGNYVHDCEQAIGVVDFPATYGPPWADYLSDVTVSNNIIDNNEWGITINNDARNIRVTGNTITNCDYNAIDVWNYGYGDPSPTNVEIHYNNIYNNGWGLWTDSLQTDTVNATYNWWGDDSGPYNASSNPSGLGDGVEGNVVFDPWIVTSVEDTHTEEVSGSTTVDALGEADTEIDIETTDSTNVTVVSYDSNPADDLPGGAKAVGNYIDVDVEDPSVVNWPIEIRIYYTQADLDALKITEDQILGMYYWNGTAWVLYNDTGVNTANVGIYEGYVWGLAWNEDMLSPKAGGGLDNDTPISDSYVTYDPDGYVTKVSTFHIYGMDEGWWRIKYRINDGEVKEGEWNKEVHFQLGKEGEYKIEYWAVDGWGHEEKHHIETYIVDLQAPSVEISFDGIYEVTQTVTYHISPLTSIILSAYDEGCGVDRIEYRVDDGETISYMAPFTLPDGAHDLYVVAYDNLGNMDVKHYSIQVGGGEPTTSCHLNPAMPDGENGWYLHPITVTLKASDDASGVAKTFYRIDAGEWREYTGAFEVGDGKHVVSYYSVDNAGFVEKTKSININVDIYAPEININKPRGWLYIADRAIMPLPGDDPIIIGRITIDVMVSDPLTSGVHLTTIYVDGDIKAEGGSHITYTVDERMFGWHSIKVETRDVAGNVATKEVKMLIYNINIVKGSS